MSGKEASSILDELLLLCRDLLIIKKARKALELFPRTAIGSLLGEARKA
jgi:hypothetical protein